MSLLFRQLRLKGREWSALHGGLVSQKGEVKGRIGYQPSRTGSSRDLSRRGSQYISPHHSITGRVGQRKQGEGNSCCPPTMCYAAFVPITALPPFLDHAGRHDAPQQNAGPRYSSDESRGLFSNLHAAWVPRGHEHCQAGGKRSKPGAWEFCDDGRWGVFGPSRRC